MMKTTLLTRTLTIGLFGSLALAACGGSTTIDTGSEPDGSNVSEPDGSNVSEPDGSNVDTTLPSDDADNPDADNPDADNPIEEPLGAGTLAEMQITITHPDAADVSYSIVCLGDTATLVGDNPGVNEAAACSALAQDDVRTRLVDGVPEDLMCDQLYGGPDEAHLVGTYDGVDGTAVDTTINRNDGCGISDWDVLLSAVLPAAIGITE